MDTLSQDLKTILTTENTEDTEERQESKKANVN